MADVAALRIPVGVSESTGREVAWGHYPRPGPDPAFHQSLLSGPSIDSRRYTYRRECKVAGGVDRGADVLRIHFTPEDIGRVRIANEPDPMWETVFSVFRLRRPGPVPIFGRWREHA